MPSKGQTGTETTPTNFADTLAPEVAAGHSFSVQAIFELQRAFGKVEKAVESLEKQMADQAKTLRSIEIKIALATGAMVIVSAVVGLCLKYGLDMLTQLLAKH
jgi:hypothetical protein